MEAHALVARMAAGGPEALPFPFLCLLVSGGHNLLVLVKGVGDYMQLGTTVDDAIGEQQMVMRKGIAAAGRQGSCSYDCSEQQMAPGQT
jgi:tRNA A37 threonylcarbamoyltransferase TsaD